jgi:uncharacterized protein Smg (DUF494 family)
MQERIVEIILFLISEMRSQKRLAEVDVHSLTREGYTQTEISTAFSWLFDRIQVGQSTMEPGAGTYQSHRVLHTAEKMIIALDAQGYILQCRELGLLTAADVETIIERVMAAGFSTVGLQEVKSLIAGLLFDTDNPLGANGHFTLGSKDSIH